MHPNAKVIEGNQSPDRNAQFEHLNTAVTAALAAEQPVISVDTKKKELVGVYKNAGQGWEPQGSPVQVKVHDFVDPELGRASPYGVYDIGADEAWVSVGTDHDTSAFAVQTIRRWWFSMGCQRYPQAKQLLIPADGGGSNGHRVRLWKRELSRWFSSRDRRPLPIVRKCAADAPQGQPMEPNHKTGYRPGPGTQAVGRCEARRSKSQFDG